LRIDRPRFERQTFDADYQKADIVSVRLTFEERQWLEALKKSYNSTNDSTALKSAAFIVFRQHADLEEVRTKK